MEVDDKISVALTCKYMGWDWHAYHSQPLFFIQIVNLLRKLESEEIERNK